MKIETLQRDLTSDEPGQSSGKYGPTTGDMCHWKHFNDMNKPARIVTCYRAIMRPV